MPALVCQNKSRAAAFASDNCLYTFSTGQFEIVEDKTAPVEKRERVGCKGCAAQKKDIGKGRMLKMTRQKNTPDYTLLKRRTVYGWYEWGLAMPGGSVILFERKYYAELMQRIFSPAQAREYRAKKLIDNRSMK